MKQKNRDFNDNKDLKEKLISYLNLDQKNIREASELNLQSNDSNFNFNTNSIKNEAKNENLIISKPVEIFSEWPNLQILKVKKNLLIYIILK
jgi:hypothetical protein